LPDNLPAPDNAFLALPDHAVVMLEGPDATAFAQAQFANDVEALAEGQWQWNCWLTPKGRVIALFLMARTATEQLLLIAPDYRADVMGQQLQRFVFRRKLSIRADHGLFASGCLESSDHTLDTRIGRVADAWELGLPGGGHARTLRVGTHPVAQQQAFLPQWQACDLMHGIPRLAEAQRDRWTPQQLSLERLQAFSVKKGCYPGQEIVARTHFLGKAKRGLVLLRTSAPLMTGTELRQEGRTVGEVVASEDASLLALAVLPATQDIALLEAEGATLAQVPLLDGMARG